MARKIPCFTTESFTFYIIGIQLIPVEEMKESLHLNTDSRDASIAPTFSKLFVYNHLQNVHIHMISLFTYLPYPLEKKVIHYATIKSEYTHTHTRIYMIISKLRCNF